jgi:Ca-activated chloride channel family protein
MRVSKAEAPPASIPNVQAVQPPINTESYDHVTDNGFLAVGQNPLSTFSIDVDTASYSVVRRFLNDGQLPPEDAVRIEGLINYFPYTYEGPSDEKPFAANIELAKCPWQPAHRLARVGIKAKDVSAKQRPAANLVFLIDVSGSMRPENKLPLVQRSLALLVERMKNEDRVAIAVYAGASGLVLSSTPGTEREAIRRAIAQLEAGGSTNGGEGIQLAYRIAQESFVEGGINRVILATDGDFNVGVTNQEELIALVEQKAKGGVFLSVLGYGMGNYKDSTLEKLADKGNGNYAYIDTFNEARKALVDQMAGTLMTVAKDVKLQIEFNPAQVSAYRLIGYENRLLEKEDFNDDKKDAGDIGAGHTVTALYELVPAGVTPPAPQVDPLKYQAPLPSAEATGSRELFTLKIRYKQPDGDTSQLLQFAVEGEGKPIAQASPDLRFAASVAEWGMILRNSPHKGVSSFDSAYSLASGSVGKDDEGYRSEFLGLVKKARSLSPEADKGTGIRE